MKKVGKTILTVISGLSVASLIFWTAQYYLGALSHLYYSRDVVVSVYLFIGISVLSLAVFTAIVIMMYRCKKVISIICAILLILFIPAALLGSFIDMLALGISGPNGCSHTTDIENYGKYDDNMSISYFPDSITEDMTVVDFSYYYKYVDISHTDLFLEVRFNNKETMDKYLTTAKSAFSKNGTLTYQNPYNPIYTDIIENTWVSLSANDGYLASYIEFGNFDSYKYVDMNYSSISYSYEELTIIYNYTYIASDIEVGNNPDDGEYYPKFLERFNVEWNPENTFKYEYIEE
ncbi:MAG: hypothetical protein IJD19_05415 [Ruminococcus sp.]|nr:hypothetical protein [Ruminococcus sp.]